MNPLRWRKITWVLNLWNVLFLLLIVALNDRTSKGCPPGDAIFASVHPTWGQGSVLP